MPGAADAADLAPEGFAGRVLGALRSSRGRVFVLLRGAVPDARGDADRLQGPVVVVLDAAAVLNNRNNLGAVPARPAREARLDAIALPEVVRGPLEDLHVAVVAAKALKSLHTPAVPRRLAAVRARREGPLLCVTVARQRVLGGIYKPAARRLASRRVAAPSYR